MAVVVNADDLGLTPGVNAGIFAAMDAGVVSDASLLANGRAFADAVAGLRERRIDAIGLHFCLVDMESPLAPAEAVAPLVEGDHFIVNRNCLFLRTLAKPRRLVAAMQRELECQYARMRDAGLRVSHLDSHQHVHLFPFIARMVADFCAERGIRFIRLVRPRGSAGVVPAAVGMLSSQLAALARARGVGCVPSFGFENSGHVTPESFVFHVDCARRQPVGEVMVHPGRTDDETRTRYAHWHYDWDRELRAVLDGGALMTGAGVRPVSYASLQEAGA
ncbi:MAG TPA: ChbG/HpnK family deacetylase [Vicinamibacterales bacterium]|nr:ChbG/HpnK family deacetylase [Vicinamibacterales bacterium]